MQFRNFWLLHLLWFRNSPIQCSHWDFANHMPLAPRPPFPFPSLLQCIGEENWRHKRQRPQDVIKHFTGDIEIRKQTATIPLTKLYKIESVVLDPSAAIPPKPVVPHHSVHHASLAGRTPFSLEVKIPFSAAPAMMWDDIG